MTLPGTQLRMHKFMGVSHKGNEDVGEDDDDHEGEGGEDEEVNPVRFFNVLDEVGKDEYAEVSGQHSRVGVWLLGASCHLDCLEVDEVLDSEDRHHNKDNGGDDRFP